MNRLIKEMLEVHESYIKVAVDIRRGVLAGGGEFHADCESVLIEDGSQRDDVWGADWLPAEQAVRYAALINIRPRVNPSMEIHPVTPRKPQPSGRGGMGGDERELLGEAPPFRAGSNGVHDRAIR